MDCLLLSILFIYPLYHLCTVKGNKGQTQNELRRLVTYNNHLQGNGNKRTSINRNL